MTEMHNGRLIIGIEELDEDHECPNCSHSFDGDVWEMTSGYHYPRAGGSSTYKCPECDEESVEVAI